MTNEKNAELTDELSDDSLENVSGGDLKELVEAVGDALIDTADAILKTVSTIKPSPNAPHDGGLRKLKDAIDNAGSN